MYTGIDDTLLSGLRKGDEEAYSRLFTRYGKLLYSFAYRYLKSETDAEDAVQHTFMKLWINRRRFSYDDGALKLLYTIMKNHVQNELRHRNVVMQANYAFAQAEGDGEGIEREIEREIERRGQMEQLVSRILELPDRKRDICLLKLMKGMSNKEIAKALGITVPTVKVHYNQAVKMLKKSLLAIVTLALVSGI